MSESPILKLQGCTRFLAAAWRRLWFAPPLQLRAAESALRLPLRPSSRLRAAGRVLLLVVLAYVVELALTGHFLVMLLVVLAATGCAPVPRACCDDRKNPAHLVILADGQLQLRYPDGATEQVRLQPESMRLGAHLLLVLRNESHSLRLLLGPDNLAATDLAALRRRLPAGPAAAATALHSAASGSKPDPT